MSVLALAVSLLDRKNNLNSQEQKLIQKDPEKMTAKELKAFVKELQTAMIEGNKYDVEEARRLNSAYNRNATAEKVGLESARRNGVTEIDHLSVYYNAAKEFKGMSDAVNSDLAEDRAVLRRVKGLVTKANNAKDERTAKGLLIDAAKSLQIEMRDDAALRNEAVKIYDPTAKKN
jgi:hypothetical protein